ncbi:MAG: class I SAM-dependent methyltransferase [Micromonosporaceae bacterium]
MTNTETVTQPALKDQAGKLLGHLAGYVGHRTIEIGLRLGLVSELAQHEEGISPETLAAQTSLDPFYVGVWCQSGYAADVLDETRGRYRLAPHLATLLLDLDSPAYMGGGFVVLSQPEVFDKFAERLPSGEHLWWDQCSAEWIAGVAGTGRAFYNRLIPGGLERVPGLVETLTAGARALETACGAGVGLVKLATRYPKGSYLGVDGDAYSLELAADKLRAAEVTDRVDLAHSPLEDLAYDREFDVVINNISMHECRDIDKVIENTYRALKPGGVFVISDFPFPDTPEGLRAPAGRFMSGIQFFEALIDDQLLPVRTYLELLARHGFRDIDTTAITPVHAVTYGRR